MKEAYVEAPLSVLEKNPQYRQASPLVRVEKRFEEVQAKLSGQSSFFFVSFICLRGKKKRSSRSCKEVTKAKSPKLHINGRKENRTAVRATAKAPIAASRRRKGEDRCHQHRLQRSLSGTGQLICRCRVLYWQLKLAVPLLQLNSGVLSFPGTSL
ncbi:unnamed protein product [Fraxinus pennsylvanica]|uniref:Uncharacterized protein n=1 Tax=Fraxinus pennsylvanica TaxID=56036 RepID=A0AAD2ECZ1_9LAMI|nr:unnamed protein product [Fraxinus pennsylvanica]